MHVIAAARAVGAGGCVIGVEPQPAALLRARGNIDLNAVAGSVRLVSAAVSHRTELMPMPWSNVENSGAASLLNSGPGFVVPLLQLSTIIESVCPGPLHLMLLDVQGYELEALKGCDGLLGCFEYVYAECSFMELYEGQPLADTIIAWLRERGFRLQGVYNLTYNPKGRAVQGDFLFVHK